MQWACEGEYPAHQHLHRCSLTTCSSIGGDLFLHWQLQVSSSLVKPVGCVISLRTDLIERYTSTKFGLYFFHLSLPGTRVWLICHWFGAYYFFIDLLRNIILYAIGLRNFHSEVVLNTLRAKTNLVSEHNLQPETKHLHTYNMLRYLSFFFLKNPYFIDLLRGWTEFKIYIGLNSLAKKKHSKHLNMLNKHFPYWIFPEGKILTMVLNLHF